MREQGANDKLGTLDDPLQLLLNQNTLYCALIEVLGRGSFLLCFQALLGSVSQRSIVKVL